MTSCWAASIRQRGREQQPAGIVLAAAVVRSHDKEDFNRTELEDEAPVIPEVRCAVVLYPPYSSVTDRTAHGCYTPATVTATATAAPSEGEVGHCHRNYATLTSDCLFGPSPLALSCLLELL